MGFFNDILDEIMAAAQGNLFDKVRQIIDQEKLRKKLNDMENELDKYLKENYENEIYYDSLDRYIHNGKINKNTYSDDITSAFYYTLLCAFLDSDDNFLGETRFSNYHWDNIQKNYPNDKYDKNAIKKCFMHYYNTFKDVFGCPSDTDRSSVNAIKETVNENSDNIVKTIVDESELIRTTIHEGVELILKHGNAEGDVHSAKEDKICDYNNEYQERLQDPLFLESDIDDGQKATLADVYIEPHIKFDFDNLKQWAENRESRILLLYGKAGIGKTSYTSWLSLHSDFTQECHILELRKYIDILDSINPWESIKKCFNCMRDEEYQNKVLILDGLDEVCVLKNEFDGHEFINNFCNALRTGIGRNIRIIITSRMGYFNDINKNNHIEVATIFWEKDSINDWCDAYCKIHNNRVDWCESFKKTYASLEPKDKRKDVFCTPLILYICCVSQVDISKHDSVASIYDEAFNVIGTRRYNELTDASKGDFEINKQFTKELAFQMFLNDKLEDILSSDFVQIAKEKVVCWAQDKRSYQVKEFEFEKLFAINHFAYGKNNAIEFAHKTIGEYFTAVKLYEDYFEQIDGSVDNMWHNIFNAFRYKLIPSDILRYLVDLILNKQDDNWKERFFKAYYVGIENQTLSVVSCFESEYSTSSAALINQMQITFRNLTWLFTGLGFDNSKFVNTKENLQILASYFYGDVNISGWKNLENINLTNSYLVNSNFEKSCLKYANFTSAVLNKVNFNKATLESAKFIEANLKEANLKEADLIKADLMAAHLTGADLTGAYLTAEYFTRADLTRSDLIPAHLTGANLTKAHLAGADLTKAHLAGADLTRAHLATTNLIKTDLTRANLTEAYFIGADLKEARLTEAYIVRVQFTEANLTRVNLAEADLTDTKLIKTKLIDANLTNANLTRANFTDANLTNAHLKGVYILKADSTSTHLKKTILTEADLEKAILTGAYIKNGSLIVS